MSHKSTSYPCSYEGIHCSFLIVIFGNALLISLRGWLMDYENIAAIWHYPKRLIKTSEFFFKLVTSEEKETNDSKGKWCSTQN